MTENELKDYSEYISEQIKKLKYDPNSKYTYDLMSGGILWIDELPDYLMVRMLREHNYNYRYLLAYRASLILCEERVEFRAIWEKSKQLFPNWPIFRPERISNTWKNILLDMRKVSMKFDFLIDNCE